MSFKKTAGPRAGGDGNVTDPWYASDKTTFHNRLKEAGQKIDDALVVAAQALRTCVQVEDAVKLLVEARNDHALRVAEVEKRADAVFAKLYPQIADLDSHWRQHAKVSMERYQETRTLQTAVRDANERICKLEQRLHQAEMRSKSLEEQVSTHRTLLLRATEPTITPRTPTLAEWEAWAARGKAMSLDKAATVATSDEKWVLAFGNPSDGFEYVGPFVTATDAIDYGEKWMPGQEWWTILLQEPAKE